MTSFRTCWWISFLILVLLARWWGKHARKGTDQENGWAILMDNRGRISLNHLQLLMWTSLVLSTLLGLLVSGLLSDWSGFDPEPVFEIPQTLLILMGISVGSATTAGAMKSAKDLTDQARGGGNVARNGLSIEATSTRSARVIKPSFQQVFTQEEGPQADEAVDVTKFQNLLFTLIVGLVYIVLAMQANGYPELGEQVIWLIGISHAGYVAGKLPDRGAVNL